MADISLFGNLNTALLGIYTHKLAMNVVAHNIANANTPGFSRQRPVIETMPPIPMTTLTQPSYPLQIGTGSRVKTIQRIRDMFLDIQYRQVNNRYNFWDTLVSNLHFIEQILGEPGETGIRSLADAFWNALHEIVSDPSNVAAKRELVSRAEQLIKNVKDLYTRFEQLREDIDNEIVQKVDKINSMIKRIADINKKVRVSMALKSPPNDLLDERDRILDELSDLADISYTESPDGQITLRIGDQIVLVGSIYNEVKTVERPYGKGYHELFVGNAKVSISDGKLKALLDLRDSIIVKYMRRLDEFVLYLTDKFNLIHRDGFDASGTLTGIDFFKTITSTSDDPSVFRIMGSRSLEMGPIHYVTGMHDMPSQNSITDTVFMSNDLILGFDGNNFQEQSVTSGTNVGNLVSTWSILGSSLVVENHSGGWRLYMEDTIHNMRDVLIFSTNGSSLKTMGFETKDMKFPTIDENNLNLDPRVYTITLKAIDRDGNDVTETFQIDLSGGVSLNTIMNDINNNSSYLRAYIFTDPSSGTRKLVIVPKENLNFDSSRITFLEDDSFFTLTSAEYQVYHAVELKDTLENIFDGQTGFDRTDEIINGFDFYIGHTRIHVDPAVDTLESLAEKINEKGVGVLADVTPHHKFVLRGIRGYEFDIRKLRIEGPQGFFEALGFTDPDNDPTTFDWNANMVLMDPSYDFSTVKANLNVSDVLTFDRVESTEPYGIVEQFDITSVLKLNPESLAVDSGISQDKDGDWNVDATRPVGPANTDILLKLLDSRYEKTLSDGKESFFEYLGGIVAELGVEAETAVKMKNNSEVLRREIDGERERVKGVSLDEEMTNMIKYQHAFSASARVITAVDEMIGRVIDRLGVVGR